MPWTATLPGRVYACGRYFDLDTASSPTPAGSSGLDVVGVFAPPLHRAYPVWGESPAPSDNASALCRQGGFSLEYPAGLLSRYGLKGAP